MKWIIHKRSQCTLYTAMNTNTVGLFNSDFIEPSHRPRHLLTQPFARRQRIAAKHSLGHWSSEVIQGQSDSVIQKASAFDQMRWRPAIRGYCTLLQLSSYFVKAEINRMSKSSFPKKNNRVYKSFLTSQLILSKLCKKFFWNLIDPRFPKGFYDKMYIFCS